MPKPNTLCAHHKGLVAPFATPGVAHFAAVQCKPAVVLKSVLLLFMCVTHMHTGPGPYMPKPRHMYAAVEMSIQPRNPNILSADDGEYWKAVRQAAAPCFSMSNLKQVGRAPRAGQGGGMQKLYTPSLLLW